MSISFERKRLFPGFDGKYCKINPKIMTDGKTQILTWTKLLLTGSDVAFGTYMSASHDGGKTFSEPKVLNLHDRNENGVRRHCGITTSYYNKFHNKWILLGTEENFENDDSPICYHDVACSRPMIGFFDIEKMDVAAELEPIPIPFECISCCPHSQIMELENGDMLVSFYFITPDKTVMSVMTVRYALDGNNLRIVKVGTPIRGEGETVPKQTRGLGEPSVARLKGRYYITLRNDKQGMLAMSDDGYNFSTPQVWRWDDGEALENYNTMQRWVRFKDCLYLTYTRKNGINNHVFRHRAPIYMTRFDEENMCLVRDEEIILVPELGARLGNYSVAELDDNVSVLTTAEWMQPVGCEKYGSDNSIWYITVKAEE